MSLGRHTIANILGAVVPMIVALITVPIYLRYIGAERYGVLAVIWALLGYFGFLDLGLGRAVTQRMARHANAHVADRSSLLWTALSATFLLGLIGSVLLWFVANYMLTYIVDMSDASRLEAKAAVYWLLVALPVVLPGAVLSGALQARMRFVQLNVIQVSCGILGQLLPLAVATSGRRELLYLVPAVLVARILSIVMMFVQCRRHVPLIGRPRVDREHLRPMLGYGGWMSLLSILGPLLVTIDRLIIASMSGARAVAQYTVPYDLVSRVMVISGSLSSALFPRLASAGLNEGKLLASNASATLVAVVTPITIVGLSLLQPFLAFWVGTEFAAASKGVGEFILLGVWANAIVIPHNARYLAAENPRTVVFILVAEIPFYMFSLWYGITHWGIVGAAAVWCLRVFVDTILLLRLNSVLALTLRTTMPSLFLVVAACAVLLFVSRPDIQLTVAGLLLTLSFAKDQNIIRTAYRHIRSRGEATV